MSRYEIPSLEIVRHFARLTHDIDFSRGDSLPLCRKCGQPISGDQWAAMEVCPQRPPKGVPDDDQ